MNNKVNEYNFKTPFHKAKAAIYIAGKRKGKSEKEIKQDMAKYFAKQQAMHDINKDRAIKRMRRHDQSFNSPVTDDTFNIDFSQLDDFDPYYDDFSKNNKASYTHPQRNYYMSKEVDSYLDESYNNINEKRDWDKWEEEWKRRENTPFGKTLNKLNKEMFNMFGEYDEYGCPESPLTYIIMDYFDGDNNLLQITKNIEYKLENYDMLQEPHIKRLLNKLYKLAKNNNENKSNMNESLKSSNNKNNIKIAFIPQDNIDPIDDLYQITDTEFLNIAATKGKIYNIKDFEFAYNNLMFKYNHHNYYVRVIM